MLRLLAALYRTSPIGTSALLHGVVFVIAGAHGSGRARPSPTPAELAIEVESAPEKPEALEPESPQADPTLRSNVKPHHHDYPVPPGHDSEPHDPSVNHAPALATAPSVEPARFVLPSSPASVGGWSPKEIARTSPAPSETFSENRVSVRARLAHAAPVAYPPDARDVDLEADVPVDIVVDASGRVIDARSVGNVGHGFDQAAIQAVRGYRFTPAERDGQPVRVRMRWLVHFRLR